MDAAVSAPQYRWNIFKNIRQAIDQNEGGLEKFTQGELCFIYIYMYIYDDIYMMGFAALANAWLT